MNSKIVVTGMGLVTPLGNSIEEVWNKIIKKESAFRHWDDLEKQGFRTPISCRVEGFESNNFRKGSNMAIFAIQKAIGQAQISPEKKKTGVFVGSTLGESVAFEEKAEGKNVNIENYTCASFAEEIKRFFHLNGISRTYGTACAAGNYAIDSGAQLLKRKLIDVAIAGGVDPFSRIAMAGFSRSRAMSPAGICKPFDKNRSGMVLSEGAAFLILEREQDALKRNVKPLAVVGEMGLTCDAYHPTSPNPDGKSMEMAMRKALSKQELAPADVNSICAHGTGTRISDKTEALAISNIFEDNSIPVFGIKGAMGHSLGAATAIETVISVAALTKQIIPPTVNFEENDSELKINVTKTPTKATLNWVLNCGYAFGGLNSALLLGKWT